jgi:hypothetical protein
MNYRPFTASQSRKPTEQSGNRLSCAWALPLAGVACLFLAGCGDQNAPTATPDATSTPAGTVAPASPAAGATTAAVAAPSVAAGQATITASPNPVPTGDGPGKTTITWNTGDAPGQVYVIANGEEEKLFGEGVTGSSDAPWISGGGSYVFNLYAGKEHSKLLGTVKVTREF